MKKDKKNKIKKNNLPLSCAKCSAPACIGSGLLARCEKHFLDDFDSRVRQAVREYHMISPGERVAVALSGGKDSTVMLHQLVQLSKRLPMRLLAILVDEGIADYRAPTIAVARKECKKLKVPLHIVSFRSEFGLSLDSMLKKEKAGRAAGRAAPVGACSFCGVFRRTLLQKAALRLNADKLALGHNLDDAAQTVLLNLYRNEPARLARFWPISDDKEKSAASRAGPAPVASQARALPAELVPRIRPLIRCSEKEVALWAALNSVPIHYGACPYAVEAMRQTVRAQLNQMEDRYPGTKVRIFNAFVKMRNGIMDAVQEGEEGRASPSVCPQCGEMSSGGLCAACRMLKRLGGGRKRKTKTK